MAEETTAELIERLQRELAAAREGQAGAILVQDSTLRDCKRLGELVTAKSREVEELKGLLRRARYRLGPEAFGSEEEQQRFIAEIDAKIGGGA